MIMFNNGIIISNRSVKIIKKEKQKQRKPLYFVVCNLYSKKNIHKI